MTNICLYLQIHQPWRLKKISILDVGKNKDLFLFDDELHSNQAVLKKVSNKSYKPMLSLLKKLVTQSNFKLSLSVTGVVIEQMEQYDPDLISLLKELSDEGVEFLSETYFHSLSSLYSPTEFLQQVWEHKRMMKDYFGQEPTVFRNTELIYSNFIAKQVKNMGFKGMLAEGADKVLRGRKSTRVYKTPDGLSLLLKHYQLSDDIAFRFSEYSRSSTPLTAETFCHWINSSFGEDEIVNLFMDFETFGEHQWSDTGIFSFFESFVHEFTKSGGKFLTVSDALKLNEPVDIFDSDAPVSWADTERDTTAWTGNQLQVDSLEKIYSLENKIIQAENSDLIDRWRKLQTSDHFYYMCTKWASDGDVHSYFSPFKNPHLAYVNYGFALTDLNIRLKEIYG